MSKKTILIIFIIIVIMFSNNIILAQINMKGVKLYSKISHTGIIQYDGKDIELEYIVYKNNGKEYPVYRNIYDLIGVTVENPQIVDVTSELLNMEEWRIVTSGYPYKTYTQLGCNSEVEAYLATKLAIYDYWYNYEIGKFKTSNQMGQRILKVMQEIVSDAKNRTDSKITPNIQILSKTYNNGWMLDVENPDYVYKVYEIKCEQLNDIKTKVILEGDVPKGIKLTNLNNEEKNKFEYNEDIKISIPMKNLIKDGEFNLKMTFECNTLPVYYSWATDIYHSNYIITSDQTEEITTTKKVEYNKHVAQAHIKVQDAKTEEPIENVEFELLNQEKQFVNKYKTDEKGEITINEFPGKYYLKQTKINEIYSMFEGTVPLEMELYKQLGICFNINKKEKIVLKTEEKSIVVSEIDKTIDLNSETLYIKIKDIIQSELSSCPLEKQEDNKKPNENIDNTQQKQDNIKEDKKEQISEVIKTTQNVKKLPRTGM